jgi:hypothetical protein
MMSLREVARRLGVTHGRIQRAIETGRLERSIGYDARQVPYVRSFALAVEEWERNRDDAQVRPQSRSARSPRQSAQPQPPTPTRGD